MGVSPRSSYVNLSSLHSSSSSPIGSPTATNSSGIAAGLHEKERLARAEIERMVLEKEDGEEKAKKEEVRMPVASPGMSICVRK